MLSNSVCNHTRDKTNRTPAMRLSDFVNHSYDYRPNWTPLSPVTITYHLLCAYEKLIFLLFMCNISFIFIIIIIYYKYTLLSSSNSMTFPFFHDFRFSKHFQKISKLFLFWGIFLPNSVQQTQNLLSAEMCAVLALFKYLSVFYFVFVLTLL